MNKKLKPIWLNYKQWEDYNNGMYLNGHDDEKIKKCTQLFKSKDLKSKMKKTTIDYKISSKVNLTNKMFNPVSWLGQATCNKFINATAQEVCQSWNSLTKEEQTNANNVAKEVIEEWRNEYEDIYR